ncbi:MAG TPA: hypothetical protein VLC91_12020 [Spongiibacteraceae bacterium]|nr:hypothetical protein [Spongiibacteraceae bacterium]
MSATVTAVRSPFSSHELANALQALLRLFARSLFTQRLWDQIKGIEFAASDVVPPLYGISWFDRSAYLQTHNLMRERNLAWRVRLDRIFDLSGMYVARQMLGRLPLRKQHQDTIGIV